MERDEELQQAAKSYASKMCAECINSEICKEMGLGCPRLRESIIAFSEGVKWSDEHPKNVWHSADEAPTGKDWRILLEGKNGKEWRILLDGKNGKHWVTSRYCISLYFDNWQKFVEDEALTRWAYINDLLPKGGEE